MRYAAQRDPTLREMAKNRPYRHVKFTPAAPAQVWPMVVRSVAATFNPPSVMEVMNGISWTHGYAGSFGGLITTHARKAKKFVREEDAIAEADRLARVHGEAFKILYRVPARSESCNK